MVKPLISLQDGFEKYQPIAVHGKKWLKDRGLVPFDLALLYIIKGLGNCEAREIFSHISGGINILRNKYNPQEKAVLVEISRFHRKGMIMAEDRKSGRNLLTVSPQGEKLLADFFSYMDERLQNQETEVEPSSSIKDKIEKILDKHYKDEIGRVVSQYPFEKAVYVDYEIIERADLELADMLRLSPTDVLKLFREVISDMDFVTVAPAIGRSLAADSLFTERRFAPFVRVKNLPDQYKLTISAISPDWLEQLIVFEGTVIGKSEKFSRPSVARFKCLRCKMQNEVVQDLFAQQIEQPIRCSDCGGTEFSFYNDARSEWVSFQKIEVQENIENLAVGQQSAQFLLACVDDLCNKAEIGEKVRVVGVLRLMPPKTKGVQYSNYIDVLSIDKTEKDLDVYNVTPLEEDRIQRLAQDPKIYEKLIQSVAPSIYGMEEIKEALLLQLFGGRRNKVNPNGGKERSDMHILLIGDPGVAKTKIMEEVARLWPRSIEASGKGASGCGLTASVMKDDANKGRFILKAGAIVLANGGLLWIDEFDKMEDEDRKRMNDGMESQVIKITKADIVAKMKCETTILAAANPKLERFDRYKPMYSQFNIPPSLLSRFDLIFVILDRPDLEADRMIAEKVVANHSYRGEGDKVRREDKPAIKTDLLRKYIAYARTRIEPTMPEDVKDYLVTSYTKIRATAKDDSVPITARQLPGLIRLAEASAKVRLSATVEMDDARRAVRTLMKNLRDIASDPSTGDIDIDRIMTSHPRETRATYKIVESIIREGADRNGEIAVGTVLAHAAEKRIDEEECREIIQELKKNGTIYEPKHNTLNVKD